MSIKTFFICAVFILSFSVPAFAEVSIETNVSRTRLSVGEDLTLDIVISNADGSVSQPKVSSIEGFSSFSQGHSQEISFINGRKSSRSIFSYVLIANSTGTKSIGPFEIEIGDKAYRVAPVQVVVTDGAGGPSPPQSRPPAVASAIFSPPRKALPAANVKSEDIFVKVWLDKDEVYVNEPATMTYTLYTRLTATYKGFDKEPETTGFWVEDFPPDKTLRRTEQIINSSRYVVADVRKVALFPTQAGVFSIDPGTLSVAVEMRDEDNFDTFFSYNIFGRRGRSLPSFVSQVVPKLLHADKVTLTAKALPEQGRPAGFNGAVGRYRIEGSVDKEEVHVGDAVTYRVRITGEGNINTIQTPAFPKLEDFKIYDSASSTHISKDNKKVEGEKVTETVIVPKKAGVFTIPALDFVYFDSETDMYKGLRTATHILSVKPPDTAESPALPVSFEASSADSEKENVAVLSKDIRYIKSVDDGRKRGRGFSRNPLAWILNLLLIAVAIFFSVISGRRTDETREKNLFRMRRSYGVARSRLKSAASLMKRDKADEFYAEISRAVYGYFSDKLGVSPQSVSLDLIEKRADEMTPPKLLSDTKALFNELSLRRFGKGAAEDHPMKETYSMADRVIASFEKVKLK